MNQQVKAYSYTQIDCGKKVSQSKKKLQWTFQIGQQHYLFQIVNSIISGKKVILINNQEIYTQKNVLNVKFDFTHTIDGHILRVTKQLDSVNKFELRIDNKSFWELTKTDQNVKQQKKEEISDPFADFSNAANQKTEEFSTSNKPSNDFGDFDFDNFKVCNGNTLNTQNSFQTQNQNQKPKTQVLQEVNFITNCNPFETNCQQKVGNQQQDDFAARFAKGQQNMINQDVFATNAYVKYAKYNPINAKYQAGNRSNDYAQNPQKKENGFDFKNFSFEKNVNEVYNQVKEAAEKAGSKVKNLVQNKN